MTRRVLAITLAIVALAGLTGLLAFVGTTLMPHSTSSVAVVKRAGPEFAEPGAVPIGRSFELIDHSGRSVDASTYLGKFLLVFFGFANCPDVCPTTLGDIAQAMELLGPDAGKIQPLFISLDPERDSMAILAEYVRAFHPAIVGLTGTAAQIKAAAASYQVFYEKVPSESSDPSAKSGAGYQIAHQGNTYLMSPSGDYMTHFSYGTGPAEMAATVRRAEAAFNLSKRIQK